MFLPFLLRDVASIHLCLVLAYNSTPCAFVTRSNVDMSQPQFMVRLLSIDSFANPPSSQINSHSPGTCPFEDPAFNILACFPFAHNLRIRLAIFCVFIQSGFLCRTYVSINQPSYRCVQFSSSDVGG